MYKATRPHSRLPCTDKISKGNVTGRLEFRGYLPKLGQVSATSALAAWRGMGSEIEEHWRLPYCIKPSDHVRGLLRCSCLPGSCCQASDGATHNDELRFAYDFLLPVGTPVLAPHHAL